MKKAILFVLAIMPMMLSTSCSKDNEEEYYVDKTPIKLEIGESKIMKFMPNTSSQNPFIVKVTDTGIRADHVGKTSIYTAGIFIPVEVKGKYNIYPDPITKWGCSKSYVKSNYKSGVSCKEDNGNLVYENCGKAMLVMYTFEYGELNAVAAIVKSYYASEIGKYMSERYFVIPYDLGDYTFGGADAYSTEKASTFVYLKISDNAKYIVAIYLEAPNGAKTKSMEISDKKIKEIESKLIKYLPD